MKNAVFYGTGAADCRTRMGMKIYVTDWIVTVSWLAAAALFVGLVVYGFLFWAGAL